MDLKTFTDDLKIRMQAKLAEVDLFLADVRAIGLMLSFLRSIVKELDEFAGIYKFKNLKEEIGCFKHVKPEFMSQLFFYENVFHLKLCDQFRNRDMRMQQYHRMLQRLEEFAIKHYEDYQYYFGDRTENDARYFKRSRTTENGSVHYDILVARILSHELFRDYITALLKSLNTQLSDENDTKLKWTASKVDLIELVYALHASEVFNKGTADLKEIANTFERMFDVSLGNYYRGFLEIRQRKKGQTNFVDAMKVGLTRKLQEMD